MYIHLLVGLSVVGTERQAFWLMKVFSFLHFHIGWWKKYADGKVDISRCYAIWRNISFKKSFVQNHDLHNI